MRQGNLVLEGLNWIAGRIVPCLVNMGFLLALVRKSAYTRAV